MKTRLSALRPRVLKLLIPACGVLGLVLRILLTATGIDDKGLMVSNHPAWILMLILTAAVALAILAGTRAIRGPETYRNSFPRSLFPAAGCVLAAISGGANAAAYWQAGLDTSAASNFMAAAAFYLSGGAITLSVAAFVLVALCRLTERKPPFLLHVLICVYFALQMLTLYQTWSFDPQVQEYCFQLLACIALTMTAYQLATFDTDKGRHKTLWFWGLAAVYLCCLSAADGLFFITGGIWAFCSLSNLRRPRKRKPAEPETPSPTE